MKLNGRSRIVAVVVVLVLAAVVAVWLIAGGSKTSTPSTGNAGATATPRPNAAPTLRPGSTETVVDIAPTDPLLPYLAPGVHIDVLKLGGGQAQVIATDLVVLGVQATGVSGATPSPIQSAASTNTPGAVATPPPSAGLVVDVPATEEGGLLPAQSGSADIAYAIVGTAAPAPSTPAPTPTPTPTGTPAASPSETPTISGSFKGPNPN